MRDEQTYGFNVTDANSLVQLIGGYETEVPEYRATGGGSSIKHAYAPSGGIPAATWNSSTETMTPGQASCRIAENVSGAYSPTSDTVLVENPVSAVVGASGKPMTIGKNTSGKWTVLVEDCTGGSSSGGGPLPDPQDPVDQENGLGMEI